MARAKWALGALGLTLLLLLVRLVAPGWFVTGESGNSLLGYLAADEFGVEAGPRVPDAAPQAHSPDAAEQRLIDLVNAARVAEGLLPLKRSAALMSDARRHSQEMSSGDFFGAEDLWGREPLERLHELGYREVERLATNLAAGLPDADAAFQAWMAAAPYRHNILDPALREIGVGYASDADDDFGPYVHYWTVALGARRGIYPVVIANEAASTSAAQVELAIHGQGWAEQMAVSNSRLFSQDQLQPHRSRLPWRLDASQGEAVVYVALADAEGAMRVVSDTIRLEGRVVELQRGLHDYRGVADTAITSWQPERNAGQAAELAVGAAATSGGSGKQALLRFDLTGIAPATKLQEAILALHLTAPPSEPLTLEAYALSKPWEETAATWWQAVPGILWGLPGASQPGSDRQSEPVGTWVVQPISSVVEIDLTTLAQEWIARPDRNDGLLLSGYSASFASCAVASSEHKEATWRPLLRLHLLPGQAAEPTATPVTAATATVKPCAPEISAPVAEPEPTQQVGEAVTPAASASLRQVLIQGLGGYAGATDTTLDAARPQTPLGLEQALHVSSDGSRVALLRFDTTLLPSSARVQQATLGLYVSSPASQALEVTVYGMARPWLAEGATWLGPQGDETWAIPGADGPGSDRTPYPLDAATISPGTRWVSLDVTDLVEAWLHDSLSNDGLVVKGSGEAEAVYALASAECATPDQRPRLTITYTLP